MALLTNVLEAIPAPAPNPGFTSSIKRLHDSTWSIPTFTSRAFTEKDAYQVFLI
jgi:hypothetical protein